MAGQGDDLLPLLGINQHMEEQRESDSSSVDSMEEDTDSDNISDIDIEQEAVVDAQHAEDNGPRLIHPENLPQVDLRPRRRDRKKKEKKTQFEKKTIEVNANKPTIINFDQSLPSSHSYLGNDLEELRGRTILEENSIVIMPLLMYPGVVLVPGQVLPLQLHSQPLVAMVRQVADTDKTFGVLNLSRFGRDMYIESSNLGCTAEIFSMKDDLDDSSGLSTVTVKARGRQRFEVISTQSTITGEYVGKVKILPEVSLNHALSGVQIPSLCRLAIPPSDNLTDDCLIKTAVDRQGRVLTSVDLRRKSRVTRLTSAHVTWWPPWVYKMYDIDWLSGQIRSEIQNWCPSSLPPSAVELSFWVAHNLPVPDELRLKLLSFDSVVQRLRFGLSIIQKSGRLLCCDECEEEIANKGDIFSMSKEGPLGAYVNPHGHVHEMFTVTTIKHLDHIGGAHTEHSWFPGYAWTIVQCKMCHSHMGWKFTATKKDLSPRKFWGLCRSSVKTTFGSIEETEDEEMVVTK